MRASLILVSAALVLSATSASAQRLRITVGGANFRPYPIAAPDLEGVGSGDKLARDLTELLHTDLDLARPLELVPPKTYLAGKEPMQKPDYQAWLNVGASGLIRGQVEVLDGGKAKVSLRFFDVVARKDLLSKTFDEPVATAGRAVHQFVDQVIELLTGEAGIFSSKISFVKRTSGGKAVFISDVTGSNQERMSEEGQLALLPAWDPTGRFLLFTSYVMNNPDLFRLDRSNRDFSPLSQKRGLNTGAAVSPDGKRIAMTLSIDGNTEIYVMDWDGKNLKRLTDNWGQDMSPSWSPDGSRIAFVSSRAGNPHIYIMNADGSGVRRLTFQGNYNQEPDWSPRPDGRIAFTARDERLKFDIFLVHPETSEITRLTQDEGNNESPSHSPDGHNIVFVSSRPGANKKLFVMDVDGQNQRRITGDAGEYETPSWGPRLGYK